MPTLHLCGAAFELMYYVTVPSIATEYVKNRVQHDRTARQWTQLYARPPAPPPPPVASAPVAAATNSRARAKARTSATGPTAGARSTTRSQPSSSRQEPIVIDDSDNESGAPQRPAAKRKRNAEEVEDIRDGSARATRRKTGRGAASAVPESEIIVIED
jgi:hypothetical protein